MECFPLSLGVQPTKQLDRGGLRCCGECKHRNIRLLTVALNLVGNDIFHIGFNLLTGTQGHSDCCHVLTSSRRMRLVNDNCKTLLLQPSYTINDIWEFLNSGSNDFRIAVQCNCKVCGITLIIHYADQASLVFHAHNCFLQLTVNNHTVCNDDDIIENNFIVSIVQRSQPVSQPCDGIRLAGTCAVLNQIVLCGMVFSDICKNTANHVKLMIPGKDQIFGTLYLASFIVNLFFHFHENEFADQIQYSILCQDILPHIGHAVLVLKCRVAGTGGDALTVTHIERQEEGRIACQFCGHVHFFQVHSEVDQATSLKEEQPGFGIALGAVLIDSIVIGLSSGIALQLKGNDRQAIQEDNHIDPLFVAGPHFFHDREDVLAVLLG